MTKMHSNVVAIIEAVERALDEGIDDGVSVDHVITCIPPAMLCDLSDDDYWQLCREIDRLSDQYGANLVINEDGDRDEVASTDQDRETKLRWSAILKQCIQSARLPS